MQNGLINRDAVIGQKRKEERSGKEIQTTNYISPPHKYSCHNTAAHQVVFRVSLYWFMYSVITSENELV